jgi:hypothetical protein
MGGNASRDSSLGMADRREEASVGNEMFVIVEVLAEARR